MGTQSKLNDYLSASNADEAVENYELAKTQMRKALTSEGIADDVIYYAARVVMGTYETVKKIAPDRLVLLTADNTLEKAADGEITPAEAMKRLVARAVNAKITELFNSAECGCEYDEQIRKNEKGSTYYKCDRNGDNCDERLVLRDTDNEIIAQIHFVASEADTICMTVYVDAWAGDGADDLTESQLRKRITKEVRKVIQDEDDDEDLLQVKIKLVEEPLFDLDFGLSMCE